MYPHKLCFYAPNLQDPNVELYKSWAKEFIGERGENWQLIWFEVYRFNMCFKQEEDLIVFKLKFKL